CSSSSARLPENVDRTEATSAADTTKVTAFMPNTTGAPTAATSRPPRAGPDRYPMFAPRLMVPLAQARSSGGTRFGTAALAAGKNGDSVTEARKGRGTSARGDRGKAE